MPAFRSRGANCSACGATTAADNFVKGRTICKACHAGQQRAYRAANPEAVRETKRRYAVKADPVERRRKMREWRERTDSPERREGARQRSRAWRAANRERHREAARQWAVENPERYRLNMRDAQRRRRVGRDETAHEYANVLRLDPCSYCGVTAGTIDHIDPIALGGANVWANLTAACLPCNSAKHDLPLLVYLARM